MIDWSKPIEMVDGSPATVTDFRHGSYQVYCPNYPDLGGHTTRVFYPSGIGKYDSKLQIRNKEINMIDVNKPVLVGTQEAKIVHTFEDGRMAVVMANNPNVLTFPVDGYLRGVGQLANKPVYIERWLAFNPNTHTSGVYPTLEAAKRYKGTNNKVGITKLFLKDGIVISTEVVHD